MNTAATELASTLRVSAATAKTIAAATKRFGSAITSSAQRYGTTSSAPRRAGSWLGRKRAANIPRTEALKAVNAGRKDPKKRLKRKSRFVTAVLKTISSIRVSWSRTIAFAQKTA